VTFGELRRTVPENLLLYPGGPPSYSDPEGVLKGGVQFEAGRHFMIAPSIGAGVDLDSGGTSGTLDVELNFMFGGGAYIGTGVGWWNFNDLDNDDATMLVQAGIPIVRNMHRQARLLFVVEGRLFFDHFNNIENNYQYGAGFRWVFK